MITEWLVGMGGEFGAWVLSILPGIPLIDGWVGGATALGAFAGSLGVWVDWFGISLLVVQVMTLYFLSLAVRILRAVIGHVPMIGGNG